MTLLAAITCFRQGFETNFETAPIANAMSGLVPIIAHINEPIKLW